VDGQQTRDDGEGAGDARRASRANKAEEDLRVEDHVRDAQVGAGLNFGLKVLQLAGNTLLAILARVCCGIGGGDIGAAARILEPFRVACDRDGEVVAKLCACEAHDVDGSLKQFVGHNRFIRVVVTFWMLLLLLRLSRTCRFDRRCRR